MQNDVFYLKEAFQRLNLLNEDSFDLSVDKGVVDELQSFVADDIEAPYEEEIIDIAADTEDELQDSYVGKVILQCDCCHTKIYKEPKEVIIDDESEAANVEEECPVCGNAFGWHVIGKIEPYDEDAFEEKPEEVEVEAEEGEFADDEIGEALKEALNEDIDIHVGETEDGDLKVEVEADEQDVIELDRDDVDDVVVDVDEACDKDESLDEDFEKLDDVNINTETAVEHDQKLEDTEEDPVLDERNEVELKEGIENLSVDTEDTHMEMTSDEEGKVVIVTEPRNDEEVVEVKDEMIAPLTDEEQDEIIANGDETEEQVEDEFDIDEFDEESFDELGESFLKRVYENVDAFETTSIKLNGGKLVVEGLIKFKSGKEKATSFKFENFKTTKRGKIYATGINETFSKSSRAFTLKGVVADKKYIPESLTYNYTAKSINEDNNSEAVKIYGRAVVRK